MKLRFDSSHPAGVYIAFVLSVFCGVALVSRNIILNPGTCNHSIDDSHLSNVKSSPRSFSCDLSYQKCLCTFLPNKTANSTSCISDFMFQCSRILPLVSFVLQILIIQELFSLDGDCSRKVVHGARIACLFIFIGLTIGIYWNSCYQQYLSDFLLLPYMLLNLFVAYAFHLTNTDPDRFRRNNTNVMYANQSERNGNEVQSWQEIL